MAQVYAISCSVNQMAYVGCTKLGQKWLRKRYREHRCLLNQRKHYSPQMAEDWHKYGAESFFCNMLEELPETVTVEGKRACELKWMEHFKQQDRLYNANMVSFNSVPGSIEKAVEAAKIANTGRTHTPTERQKRSQSNIGKHQGHGPKISATKKRLGQRPSLEAASMGGLAALAKHGPVGPRSRRPKED